LQIAFVALDARTMFPTLFQIVNIVIANLRALIFANALFRAALAIGKAGRTFGRTNFLDRSQVLRDHYGLRKPSQSTAPSDTGCLVAP
jgi:hypothetical protein